MTGSRKAVILGSGHVGSHVAYALGLLGICREIVLVDVDRDKAVSQALDVDDSIGFGAGETVVRAGDYCDVADAAVVINAIGEGRKPGQTRLDLLGRSAEMAKELAAALKHYPIPGIFLSITNPCDVVADYMRKALDLPRERAFGTGTLLDTARLVRAISRRTGIGRKNIQAFSLGEHGDSSMIPFEAIRVGGRSAEALGLSREDLLADTRQSGMVIIEGKKSTEFGIGSGTADLVKCILLDEKRIIPVSACLMGEYGETDVHCGVPCRIGEKGLEEIIQLPLSEAEQAELHASCEIIRKHIRMAEEI